MSLQNVTRRLANLCGPLRTSESRGSQRNPISGRELRTSANLCEPQRVEVRNVTLSAAGSCATAANLANFFQLYTCARACACACARTRARGARPGETGSRGSRGSQGSHPVPPLDVTLLKHCRCADCLRFRSRDSSPMACRIRFCQPEPHVWHYCADYLGPQISRDVWAWPRRPRAEVAGVAGPSGESAEDNRGGNGHETGLFRSPARTQGKEG